MKPTTIIAEDIEIEGNIRLNGMIRLYGKIKGDITGGPDSQIIIEKSGYVEGAVQCHDLFVLGTLEGKGFAKGQLSVQPSGKVIGEVRASNLKIMPGSLFEASCTMAAIHLNQAPSQP